MIQNNNNQNIKRVTFTYIGAISAMSLPQRLFTTYICSDMSGLQIYYTLHFIQLKYMDALISETVYHKTTIKL